MHGSPEDKENRPSRPQKTRDIFEDYIDVIQNLSTNDCRQNRATKEQLGCSLAHSERSSLIKTYILYSCIYQYFVHKDESQGPSEQG